MASTLDQIRDCKTRAKTKRWKRREGGGKDELAVRSKEGKDGEKECRSLKNWALPQCGLRFDLGCKCLVLHIIARATWAISDEPQCTGKVHWIRDCKNLVKMKRRERERKRQTRMGGAALGQIWREVKDERWRIGVTACWGDGVLGRWRVGEMACRGDGSLIDGERWKPARMSAKN